MIKHAPPTSSNHLSWKSRWFICTWLDIPPPCRVMTLLSRFHEGEEGRLTDWLFKELRLLYRRSVFDNLPPHSQHLHPHQQEITVCLAAKRFKTSKTCPSGKSIRIKKESLLLLIPQILSNLYSQHGRHVHKSIVSSSGIHPHPPYLQSKPIPSGFSRLFFFFSWCVFNLLLLMCKTSEL